MGRYLISAILIVIAAAGGYFFGISVSTSKTTPPADVTRPAVTRNPIFKSQTATFQGTITKIDRSSVSLKDESGKTGIFPISAKVVIYKFTGSSRQASASSDIKTAETGKQVLVVLELKDNQYQVISISYLPPAPSPKR